MQKGPYYQILGAYKIIESVEGACSGLDHQEHLLPPEPWSLWTVGHARKRLGWVVKAAPVPTLTVKYYGALPYIKYNAKCFVYINSLNTANDKAQKDKMTCPRSHSRKGMK